MRGRIIACLLAAAAVAACGPGSEAARHGAAPPPAASSPQPSASPSPSPSPSPSSTPSPTPPPSPVPTPTRAAAPVAATIAVSFSGLPAGTYPVHIHSICNGSQAFHIVVVQSLVSNGGMGTIQVPSGYFGRGLCLIVYGSPALSSVIATRRI